MTDEEVFLPKHRRQIFLIIEFEGTNEVAYVDSPMRHLHRDWLAKKSTFRFAVKLIRMQTQGLEKPHPIKEEEIDLIARGEHHVISLIIKKLFI